MSMPGRRFWFSRFGGLILALTVLTPNGEVAEPRTFYAGIEPVPAAIRRTSRLLGFAG